MPSIKEFVVMFGIVCVSNAIIFRVDALRKPVTGLALGTGETGKRQLFL